MKGKISKQQWKYIFNISILVLVTITAFAFILKDNPKEIFKMLSRCDIKYLFISIGIMILVYLTEGLILTIFARLYRRDYPYYKGVLNCLIGVFFSGITPSNSGGQFAQAYTFSKQKIKVTNAASILFMHFIVYQIVLVVFGAFVMIFKFGEMRKITTAINILGINFDIISLSVIGFVCNCLVIVGLFFLALSEWFHRIVIKYGVSLAHKFHIIKDKEKKILEINTKVETFRIEFKRLVSNWWVLLSSAFLFLVKMCLISSIPYFIAKSMHVQFAYDNSLLNFINTIAMTQFTTTITGMVPIPGASGASELVFQLMFAKFFVDCPQSTISAIIIIWRGVTFYLGLIIGCITFFAYHEKPSSSEAFKGDPRRTLLELQVINVGNEKTKTIELAALSTPSSKMEPELLTVEEIEKHFEEVRKDLENILERNDKAVNKENRKKKRASSSTSKKNKQNNKTTVVNIVQDKDQEEKVESSTSKNEETTIDNSEE